MQLDFLQLEASPGRFTPPGLTAVPERDNVFAGSRPSSDDDAPDRSDSKPPAPMRHEKSAAAFKTISEAAAILGVQQHVLRFWESRFPQIRPLKLRGGRRYYRPEDMQTLATIQQLLYKQGYTIKGARKAFASARWQQPTIETPAVPVEAVEIRQEIPSIKSAPELTDAQRSQLAGIREELLGLRAELARKLA